MTILSRSALASCSFEDIFILYYQDTDGIVRESRHHPDGSWHIVEILGSKHKVMLNTPLSVTCFRGLNNWEIHLYYLNNEFQISSIYWTSSLNKWYNIDIVDAKNKRIVAAPFSKLACTSFMQPVDSFDREYSVCFQGSDFLLKLITKSPKTSHGKWQLENKFTAYKVLSGSSLAMVSNPKDALYTIWVYFQRENCEFRELYTSPSQDWKIGVYDVSYFYKFLPGSTIFCLAFGDSQKLVYSITADNEITELYYNGDHWDINDTVAKATQGTAITGLVWDNPDVNLQLRLIYQLPNNQVQQLVFSNGSWGGDATARIMANP